MNPLREQVASGPVCPDFHFHLCESCGCSFSHYKSRIRRGFSSAAHLCHRCGLPVNLKLEKLRVLYVDYPDYYGRYLEGENMAGRARGVAVSSSSVVVAGPAPDRIGVVFTAGNATGDASAVLKDTEDATATNGIPVVGAGGPLIVEGKAATHRWSAIRLAAVDCVVGVLELYPDNFAVPEPSKGVPT